MAGVGQAELGAFDNQERALAKILWRATWGHGMRMDRRPIAASGGYAVRRVETGVGNGSSMSVDACENLVCVCLLTRVKRVIWLCELSNVR